MRELKVLLRRLVSIVVMFFDRQGHRHQRHDVDVFEFLRMYRSKYCIVSIVCMVFLGVDKSLLVPSLPFSSAFSSFIISFFDEYRHGTTCFLADNQSVTYHERGQ